MASDLLELLGHDFAITIAKESPFVPCQNPDSVDNIPANGPEILVGDQSYRTASRHRVSITRQGAEVSTCVLLATGGATGIHSHSAILQEGVCFVAVGPFICALRVPELKLAWSTKVDSATCFGVYELAHHQGLVSHGECEIARLDYRGQIVWSVGGRDIFTGVFTIDGDHAKVTDFEGSFYRIELSSGRIDLQHAGSSTPGSSPAP